MEFTTRLLVMVSVVALLLLKKPIRNALPNLVKTIKMHECYPRGRSSTSHCAILERRVPCPILPINHQPVSSISATVCWLHLELRSHGDSGFDAEGSTDKSRRWEWGSGGSWDHRFVSHAVASPTIPRTCTCHTGNCPSALGQ